MNPIDKKQIKIIHIAKSKLNLSDDQYRDILQGHYGKASSKNLTFKEAHDLIEYFKSLGFRIEGKSRKCGLMCRPRPKRSGLPNNVQFMVSPGQTAMIEALKKEVTWKYHDGYERWLSKYVGTDIVRTSMQASRTIEGLKGLLRSQADCRGCKAF